MSEIGNERRDNALKRSEADFEGIKLIWKQIDASTTTGRKALHSESPARFKVIRDIHPSVNPSRATERERK